MTTERAPTVKVGQTDPPLRATLFADGGAKPYDLGDATGVTIRLHGAGTGELITGACTILQSGETNMGRVEWDWDGGIDVADLYRVVWIVAPLGDIVPNEGWNSLRVEPLP